jgi:hypothetical protein
MLGRAYTKNALLVSMFEYVVQELILGILYFLTSPNNSWLPDLLWVA